MQVVYANQIPPDSWTSAIFLAGPTPRNEPGRPSAASWRPEALRTLEELEYDGVVFVPETEDGIFKHDYNDQIEWEELCLNLADVILFWIPRELDTLPGFTTNDEWGYWKAKDPMRLVFGTPPNAPKVRYQKYYAKKYQVPMHETLRATCAAALEKVGDTSGISRKNGERSVPLHIWRTAGFRNWYRNLTAAGNRLEDARVEWVFRVGPAKQFVFFWVLHVDVYIGAEDRHKTNEVVICRPDISTILLYEPRSPICESRIVVVKEYRSPVSNNAGYVFELAGGSSWKEDQNPLQIAVEECHEEVGLHVTQERFVTHQSRQLAATTLYHQAQLFSAQLNSEEMDEVERNSNVVRGVVEDTEQTYALVMTYGELMEDTNVDWSMLGMITSVLKP